MSLPDLSPARAGGLPDGPVELWILVFATDGALMGSARAARQPSWTWRNGKISLDYTPVHIVISHGGRYSTGLICAVSAANRNYRPLWPISLGEPQELRAGDDMTIIDGVVSLTPELPGPHG